MSSAGAPLFWAECMYGPLRRSDHERPIGEAIRRAIQRTGRQMVDPPSDFSGLAALDRFAAELPEFRRQHDATWIARFGYQVIERRGTGGGLFRRLFADFLAESQTHVAIPDRWVETMRRIAERWTAFALALKEASEVGDAGWDKAAPIIAELAVLERGLHQELAG
jgi:hypothetical protein